MKKYLALFVAPIEAYDQMKAAAQQQSPEEQEEVMKEWGAWMERHKASLADPGAPAGAVKRVTEGGTITDARNTIGGYMLIQAESHEEAAKIFDDSPHFDVKGGAIEVMELIEM